MKLQVQTRQALGKQNQALRAQGFIPAVVYGHKVKNQNIQVGASNFNKLFERAGETSLIDLEIDEQKPVKVIVQDIQRDVVKGNITHVDFHQIREDEEITVDVELEFIGESKAVKEESGILIKSLASIKIECLPANLIHRIEVDISQLKNFGDCLYVKDLKISDKVKVLDNPDEAVVSVAEPRSEKELEELAEKPEEGKLPEGAEEEEKKGEEALEKETSVKGEAKESEVKSKDALEKDKK